MMARLSSVVRVRASALNFTDLIFLHGRLPQAAGLIPLLDGAGTKIKVLESLGYLRASVVTRHSLAGFESLLRDGDSLLVEVVER